MPVDPWELRYRALEAYLRGLVREAEDKIRTMPFAPPEEQEYQSGKFLAFHEALAALERLKEMGDD